MTMGLQTWRADGVPMITALDAGGVFVGIVTRTRAQGSGTVTYPDFNGRTLRVPQGIGGSFTWTVGVNGAGDPTITFTLTAASANDSLEGDTQLLVFAV